MDWGNFGSGQTGSEAVAEPLFDRISNLPLKLKPRGKSTPQPSV